MKQWTCLFLSGILMTFSTFYEQLPQDGLSKAVRLFLGLESAPAFQEVEVDLSQEALIVEVETASADAETEPVNQEETIPRPTVLIYHTHTDEAYKKVGQDYVETGAGRTLDPDFSVVSVGNALTDDLQEYGFSVIHDTTDHVSAGFNQAYQSSLKTVEKYIGQTEIFIDLHRDAYYGQEPHVIEKDGKEYARMCFVVAEGTQYKDPPHREANEKLARKLTETINELCPNLARPIIYKNTRFNQHVGDACLLIEMGDEENTLEQVKNTAGFVAQAFDLVYK